MQDDWEMLSIEDIMTSLEQSAELPSVENFLDILQKCRKAKNLAYAKQVHAHIQHLGLEDLSHIGNYLVAMFVDCGSMPEAKQLFHRPY